MAILDIKKFKEPVLRKKCQEVERIDKNIKKLIIDMAQTMEKNRGLGLAALQIGVSQRIIVVQTDFKERRIFCLINPKILKISKEKEIGEEGCLSFPGVFLKIKRAKEIEIEGLDISGKNLKLRAKGILARVFQHEIDHLDGILFFDRLGLLKRIKFKLKYFSIKP